MSKINFGRAFIFNLFDDFIWGELLLKNIGFQKINYCHN